MAGRPRLRNGPGHLLSPVQGPGPFFQAAERIGRRKRWRFTSVEKSPLAETAHLFAAYELTLRALHLADRNDLLTAMSQTRS